MDILNVIDDINKSSGLKKPVTYYLNGGCYIFAKALQSRVGGNLRYLVIESHFVLSLDNKLYDTSGNVTNKYKNSKFISEEEFRSRPKLLNSVKNI